MSSGHSSRAHFASTRWSLVAAAGHECGASGRRALEELCRAYWYPLYAYVRRRGAHAHEAQDLVQSFFAHLLEHQGLARANSERGRFRSFLLVAFGNFRANEWRRETAAKRGGHVFQFSYDAEAGEARYALEPSHELTPERLFERRWALTVLEQALERLAEEQATAGKQRVFAALRPYLGGGEERVSLANLAAELETTPGALKTAAHRLRARFRDLLRAEVAETVMGAEEVDAELRDLLAALGTH